MSAIARSSSFAIATLFAIAQLALSQGAWAQSCDRSCLEGLLDDYLDALLAHEPSRLPLADTVRFSENNVPLNLPDGLWNTVDAVREYQIPFVDVEAGQVGMMGIVEEYEEAAHYSMRMKVVNRQITEIETVVLRPRANNGFGNPDVMQRRETFYEDTPEEERLTHVQLASIANSYFETLQQNHGVVFSTFAPDCHRIESGVATTNNPAQSATGRPDVARIKPMGCQEQFETGFFEFVTHVRDRRHVLIDPQKGLVLSAVFFDHQGDMREVELTDGRVVPTQYNTPWTWQIHELFKIQEGRIEQVEALVMFTPYASPDIWTERPRWEPVH